MRRTNSSGILPNHFTLSKSEYTIANNMKFINNTKSKKVPTGHNFMFFEVKSLFTNVHLDYTINIILRGIYDDNELYTNISKKEIKKNYFCLQKTCILLLTMRHTNNAMV